MKQQDMVRMANQMADFFRPYGEAEAIDGIADHLRKFWDPRMRRQLLAHAQAGGEGLQPLVLKAIDRLEAH